MSEWEDLFGPHPTQYYLGVRHHVASLLLAQGYGKDKNRAGQVMSSRAVL